MIRIGPLKKLIVHALVSAAAFGIEGSTGALEVLDSAAGMIG
jgi:hypothetical protein